MAYTTDQLITAAKASEFFPSSQSTFTESDTDDVLIRYATEEMQMKLVPLMMSVREEFFATSIVKALRSNVDYYAVPERSIGNSLKNVWYLSDVTDERKRQIIEKANKSEVMDYSNESGQPRRFFLEGDEVVITPRPGTVTGSEGLLFDYFERPSKLTRVANCAKITDSVTAGGTTTFTVDTDLTASLSVGDKVDFLSAKSPFKLWSKDVLITAITASTIEVDASDVTDASGAIEPEDNDYICPAQYSCIPMLPDEVHPVLSEMICYRAMKALGATTKLQIVQANIKDQLSGALKIMSNRVQDQVDVVYDPSGFLATMGQYPISLG